MNKITTVCGNIDPENLGLTSMHEHLLFDDRYVINGYKSVMPQPDLPAHRLVLNTENVSYARNNCMFFEDMYYCDDPDYVKVELDYYKECGGNTIVDASPIEWRGNVSELRKLSEETGLNIICSTGVFNNASRLPRFINATEDEIYNVVMTEINEGIGDTGVFPGMVKSAITRPDETGKLANAEDMKALRANARAAADSGYGFSLHTTIGISDEALVNTLSELIEYSGIAPNKIICNHLCTAIGITDVYKYANEIVGRDLRYERALGILELGVNIGIDMCNNPLRHGFESFNSDEFDCLREIMHLVKAGYADQVILGGDVMPYACGIQRGWTGYSAIMNRMLPMLKYVGCTDENLYKLYTGNPIRILSH